LTVRLYQERAKGLLAVFPVPWAHLFRIYLFFLLPQFLAVMKSTI